MGVETIFQHELLTKFAYPFLLIFFIVFAVLEKTNLEGVQTTCGILDELKPRSSKSSNLTPATYSSLLVHVKDRPGHDRRYAIDARKMTRELDYAPVESFETGMRKTVEWYLNNLEWCQSVMGEDYKKWIEQNYS